MVSTDAPKITLREALAAEPTKFEAALEECGLVNKSYARLGDDGQTLTLDMEGEESLGLTQTNMACMLRALDVSDAVKEEMYSTRALDGKQSGEWDDINATWRYHPDDGLDMTLTQD